MKIFTNSESKERNSASQSQSKFLAWFGLAHCCTIFIGHLRIEDRHRNPNINIRDIIWLGNQLGLDMTIVNRQGNRVKNDR